MLYPKKAAQNNNLELYTVGMLLLQSPTKITEWENNTVSKYTEFTYFLYYHNELMPDINSDY